MERHRWTEDEEQTLANMKATTKTAAGYTDWQAIGAAVGRNPNACAQRWHARHDRPLPPPLPTKVQAKKKDETGTKPPRIGSNGNGRAPAAPGQLGTVLAMSYCPNCGCNLGRINSALAAVAVIEARVQS